VRRAASRTAANASGRRLTQCGRLLFQFLVSEVFEPVFEGVDRLRVALEPAKNATFTNTKNLFKN
jgi:hypothetical protein